MSATRLDPGEDALRELERHLVLCYTGASRLSAEMHGQVWRRFAAGDAAVARALDGLRACALEMREAVEQGRLTAVGEVLSRNWAHQRELGGGGGSPPNPRSAASPSPAYRGFHNSGNA